ncbi:Phosphocarrier protein HPr [Adhaeretor mobilis]|uniref:Phosphocarrier protein HPr n=2 Tax=Adhaeretor mobilis TaxID=1930276 RepID=A0A517N2P1_9BACT|nr:Phosphocarrier protein HPr [Adhaeretor mobilis]
MNEPVQRTVVVTNPQGIHLRPAEQIARLAEQFESEITISHETFSVDAKSIIHVMTLAAREGVKLTLSARGPDAQEAVDALVQLVESDFVDDKSKTESMKQ